METVGITLFAICILLAMGYGMIALIILTLGVLAGFMFRPAIWLISKVMGLFGVQWEFRPYRRVLVLEDDRAYESREIWEGFPDDWMAFSDEWLMETFITAVIWPWYLFLLVSWPVRRLASAW